MDEETFEKNLEKLGAFLKNMKPGNECPPDDALFDYVNGELSETERARIADHAKKCIRCRFEVMRMDTERTAWKYAFRKDPDAALAGELGPEELRLARQLIASAPPTAAPAPAKVFSSLLEKYRARVEAGWEKLQAGLETALEWASGAGEPLILERGLEAEGPSRVEYTYFIGGSRPELPADPPQEARFHTLILVRPDRNDIALVYENREILRPLRISPEFSEEDIGHNHLFVIYSAGPLDIRQGETKIDPDRFAEIIHQARSRDARVTAYNVLVKKMD